MSAVATTGSQELQRRVEERIGAWRISVERVTETESSIIVFGVRDNEPVVLKVIRNQGDEWRAGEILDAFEANGVVRAYDYADGAVLLERVTPGNSLASLALDGNDEEATSILAGVIRRMSPRTPPESVATVEQWGNAFERYAASGEAQVPKRVLAEARRVHAHLCASQARRRLLHGDLHHYNVLFDAGRGWLAIDPKGVVGELEYEIGAALRNPYERPELFVDRSVIERRVERFARELGLDARRILAWGFAQAVLSAVWAVEDGRAVEPVNRWLALAGAMRPMLQDVIGSPIGGA